MFELALADGQVVVHPRFNFAVGKGGAVVVKEALSPARAAVKVAKAEVDVRTLRRAAYLSEKLQHRVALRKCIEFE